MDLLTMEERKMTAVEWLIEQFEFDESMSVDDIDKVINQAKQMEKEQIKEAFNGGYWIGDGDIDSEEDYYNQTYKNK